LTQLKTVQIMPRPHGPNKNVFSIHLNWPYDSPHSPRLGGRHHCTSNQYRKFYGNSL